jgi:NNP family nitrate/nitrite transporter-like MFS transporter
MLRDFARSGHLPTLGLAFLYFDVSFMIWVLLGVLGVHVAHDLGLGAADTGLLVALPILGGSLARIPMGLLVDRIGPKRTGLGAMAVTALPLVWAWRAGTSLGELHALGLLLGVAGGSFAVALPLASRWYPPRHQGLAMGVAGAGNSGTVLAALFAPRLADRVGWHAVFGLALIPLVVVALAFAALARESPEQPPPQRLGSYLRLGREIDTWWFCLFYMFTFGGFVGLASFLVVFFHDHYGLSRVSAGSFAALCVLSGSLLRPIGGYLADRFGGVRMLSTLLGLAALGLCAVGLLPRLGIVTALLFGVMALLGMSNGSVFQLVPQRFRRQVGVATGVVGAAGGVGGFLLPNVLGQARELSGSYAAGFFCIGAGGLGCLAVLRAVVPSWRREWLADRPARDAIGGAAAS